MKKTLLLILGLVLSPLATAEDINQSLDAAPDGTVSISNVAGSVEVRGWSRSTVEVSGTLGDDVEELVFERDGREIEIKVKVPKRMFGRKDITSDLVVRVPDGSSIELTTVSASIEVRDVRGELELQSVSGRIDAQVFGQDAEIGTVSGEINVEGDGKDGDYELSSVSGEINVNNLAGDLHAESVSGDVNIGRGEFDSVDLETVNGSIVYRAALRERGDMDVESVNGSVNLRMASKVGAEYDIETFNGSIRNCFGHKPERTSRYAPGYELRFVEGDGRASISIETLNGSINVCAG